MIAGIIPGHTPAIVGFEPASGIIRSLPSPSIEVATDRGPRHYLDAERLAKLLQQYEVERVIVERAGVLAAPDAAHSLGFASGIIHGVVVTLKIEQRLVSRKQWRDDLSIPEEYWAAVARVNALTGRSWPKWKPSASYPGHRKQLAALLVLYGCQLSHGEPQAMAA